MFSEKNQSVSCKTDKISQISLLFTPFTVTKYPKKQKNRAREYINGHVWELTMKTCMDSGYCPSKSTKNNRIKYFI